MFTGTALSVRLFVCAGLSLFIICGPYLSVVVCVFYAYKLTQFPLKIHEKSERNWRPSVCTLVPSTFFYTYDNFAKIFQKIA